MMVVRKKEDSSSQARVKPYVVGDMSKIGRPSHLLDHGGRQTGRSGRDRRSDSHLLSASQSAGTP